jgi:uncharacterized protein
MKQLGMVKTIALLFSVIFFAKRSTAQTIGTFTTVTPTTQTQNLVLPGTHTFQRIIKSGDALSLGGALGNNTDFTGYVPVSGSSTNGYLSISNETTPAGCAILGISYNYSNHTWTVNNSGNVNFLTPLTFGNTSRFCSGTVTPNNTIIVCEEDITGGDANGDIYEDKGWLIEIDPATRTVINQDGLGVPDRLWAVGRGRHENAAIKNNNAVLYTGVDDGTTGYLYKFIPAAPGNFSSGTLYVLQTTAALGNGTWKIVPNSTIAERNTTPALSTAAGAFNFNGIEDVEISPLDGKIYFAAKAQGKVYRFTDNGTFNTATDVTGLEVFVGNSSPGVTYDIDGAGSLPLEPWGLGNDNLAFDGEGNLWVCQDAILGTDRNHIWVVGPTHTQASPQVRVFATTPTRSEPTGITFTPDYKFMFLSFMSPNGANTIPQIDAAGVNVVFNTHTTVVIARSENLGPFATLPVTFTTFDARQAGSGVVINWSVTDINSHHYFSVERSTNGIDFEEIHRNNENINGATQRSFSFTDNNLPLTSIIYYRIKQCDLNGSCRYTTVKTIKLVNQNRIARIYPQPANDKLNLQYHSFAEGAGTITITDIIGKYVKQEIYNLNKGVQLIEVSTDKLGSGMYLITITDKNYQKDTQLFIKE